MSIVELGGPLGDALAANLRGRLSNFIVDETSPAIALFAPALRSGNTEGDWYGEHAGKWLVAAARAAARSGDGELRARVLRVAAWLASVQETDGYLGTYAPERRFMRAQPPRPYSWDGAPALRTWDVWTHAYLVLGLLEVHRCFGHAASLQAARRIGELCHRVFVLDGLDITTCGNHFGLSATVLIEPACDLHAATGDPRFLELARALHSQAEAHPQSAIVARALEGADPSDIATGKAYQLLWNLVGLAKLHRATGEARLLEAVQALWARVHDHHLTPGGGPWGGVAHRSREVFNAAGAFDPGAYVETCSTLAWLQLCRELLALTGDARYAEAIERTAYNDLLGAQAPNGEDWCYYSFPNGRRVHTTYWRCCKSSGAMALEELPAVAWSREADRVTLAVLGPGRLAFEQAGAAVRLQATTGYPFDGQVRVRVRTTQPVRLSLRVRVPAWAAGATLAVGDEAPHAVDAGWATCSRTWQDDDELVLELPMAPRLLQARLRNVQESRAPDGLPVAQEVLRREFVALQRGPLVFATGLVDGYKAEESLRLPDAAEAAVSFEAGHYPPMLRLHPLGRDAIPFLPAYLADGRHDGGWRLTWMPLAPGHAPPPDPAA